MIDKICKNLTNKIRKENQDIDDERAEVINYGLHLIIGELPKFLIIFGFAYIFGILDLMILSYILILPYRVFSGGFHLKSHIGCIIGTITFFGGVALMAKHIVLDGNIRYFTTLLIWGFGMWMTKLYAPADTENVPIISKKERRKKKLLAYIALTISIIASIFIKNIVISNIIIFGMLFQSISITRFAYKITKNQYGYEVYETSSQESI